MKNSHYSIRELEETERSSWDDFVRRSRCGAIFHKTNWAQIIKIVFNRPYKITALFKNNTMVSGILYWPNESVISSITNAPLTYYQGILHSITPDKKESSVNAEIQAKSEQLIDYLCAQYAFIDIPLAGASKDVRIFKWKGWNINPAFTYRIKLSSEEAILARFNQSLRRKINLSKRQGLNVVSSDYIGDMTDFIMDSYSYHSTTPPVSSAQINLFLKEIIKRSIGRIYYLTNGDENLAGLVVLEDEKNLYALFSGINAKHRGTQYSQYLHASVLILPEYRGKTFDFLGANTRQFEQFKRSFGGTLETFYRVTYYKSPLIKLLHHIKISQNLLSRKIKRYIK